MNKSSLITLAIVLLSVNLASCWPHFQLYTPEDKLHYIVVDAKNLTQSTFKHSRDTKFIVHGFGSAPDIDHLLHIKDGFLSRNHDVNVIMVDWREGSHMPDYLAASKNTKVTGRAIGNFVTDANIDPSKVHCIGHSLGAQTCGFASKTTRFPRVTGLDPAGPLFKGNEVSERLDKSDADYVDVIHTDILAGIQDAIGHKNFYPNGGIHQPGCILRNVEEESVFDVRNLQGEGISFLGCNHQRATNYFAESLHSDCKFVSTKCSSYLAYLAGICKNTSARLGYHSYLEGPDGNYYLKTGDSTPFCKN